MMTTMMTAVDSVCDSVGVEVALVAFFALGYYVFHFATTSMRAAARPALAEKQMAADGASGQYEAVLERTVRSPEMLVLGLQALAELGRLSEAGTYATNALEGFTPSVLALRRALAAIPEAAGPVTAAFEAAGVKDQQATLVAVPEDCHDLQDEKAQREVRSRMRSCRSSKHVKMVLQTLASPNVSVYNGALEACFRCNDARAAHELFAVAKAEGKVDVTSFGIFVQGLGAEHVDAAACLHAMREQGLQPDASTYSTFLAKATPASLWELTASMQQDGVQADAATAQAVAKALRASPSRENLDRALTLACVADEALANALVDACIELRDAARLSDAMVTIRRAGTVLPESAYARVIRSFGLAKDWSEVELVWSELLASTSWPQDASVGVIVEALVRSGEPDAAVKALSELRRKCPQASPAHGYSVLVKGLALQGDAAKAAALLDQIKAADVESTGLYNEIIFACARAGDMERAVDVFRVMCTSACAPTLQTYATVVKGYCSLGEMEQAIQIFMVMRRNRIQPDAALFGALLDGCARKDMRILVEQVLSDMEAAGVVPSNTSLALVVRLYAKAQDADAALELVDRMSADYGLQPSEQVYSALLHGCVRCGRLVDAEEVFEKIQQPDTRAYSLLIHGYLKHDVAEAIQLAELAEDQGRLDQECLRKVQFMARRRSLSLPVALEE